MKLAIVGLGDSGVDGPFDDPTWKIWSLPWYPYPTVDRWFEIHENWDEAKYYSCGKTRAEIAEWLNALERPVFMAKIESDIPKSVAYPFRGVREILGKPINTDQNEPYIDCSIAAMLGCACIYLRAGDTLGVWGVNADGKYEPQRANIEYILGVLRGMGVNLVIHQDSKLLTTAWPKYGRYRRAG